MSIELFIFWWRQSFLSISPYLICFLCFFRLCQHEHQRMGDDDTFSFLCWCWVSWCLGFSRSPTLTFSSSSLCYYRKNTSIWQKINLSSIYNYNALKQKQRRHMSISLKKISYLNLLRYYIEHNFYIQRVKIKGKELLGVNSLNLLLFTNVYI